MNPSRALHDVACLLLRLVLAVVFVAHGWQKFYDWTLDGTRETFTEMDVPFADVAAPGVAVLELVGGGMLGLGILTRLVAAAFSGVMVGALVLVHAENGIFIEDGGIELVLVLAGGCAAIVLLGPGRIRMDRMLVRWFSSEEEEVVEVAPKRRK
ncbi:DoxX family protein [Phytoactinopolyspora halotolerans]|uniref:DoxX family protein n=1 Tax=Phytoactinopolyspora halotolerans TaxID=1981512 RepID=A0A6L9S4A5_9ACTN|nr:DoxX family protein [Phytoactinopolyspora halotolerans]NED99351.1 DoxX family protein [Phytoactinopolyspora halotolerans]